MVQSFRNCAKTTVQQMFSDPEMFITVARSSSLPCSMESQLPVPRTPRQKLLRTGFQFWLVPRTVYSSPESSLPWESLLCLCPNIQEGTSFSVGLAPVVHNVTQPFFSQAICLWEFPLVFTEYWTQAQPWPKRPFPYSLTVSNEPNVLEGGVLLVITFF